MDSYSELKIPNPPKKKKKANCGAETQSISD